MDVVTYRFFEPTTCNESRQASNVFQDSCRISRPACQQGTRTIWGSASRLANRMMRFHLGRGNWRQAQQNCRGGFGRSVLRIGLQIHPMCKSWMPLISKWSRLAHEHDVLLPLAAYESCRSSILRCLIAHQNIIRIHPSRHGLNI